MLKRVLSCTVVTPPPPIYVTICIILRFTWSLTPRCDMQRTLSLTQSTRQAQRLAFTTNCLTNCESEYDLRTGAGDRSAVSALIWSTDTGPLLLPDRCLCSYRNGSLPYSQSSYTFPPTPSLSLSLSVTDTHTETSHDQSYLLGKTLLRRGGGGVMCVGWGRGGQQR